MSENNDADDKFVKRVLNTTAVMFGALGVAVAIVLTFYMFGGGELALHWRVLVYLAAIVFVIVAVVATWLDLAKSYEEDE